jgi:hypothetical protein
VAPQQVLARAPYLGVSCRAPNDFTCDRVGLAVWLREPALAVRASVAGRAFALDDRSWSGASRGGRRRAFAGFLRPAGLLDGPLRLTADDGRGRWIGRRPVTADVRLTIQLPHGEVVSTRIDVPLRAGWG